MIVIVKNPIQFFIPNVRIPVSIDSIFQFHDVSLDSIPDWVSHVHFERMWFDDRWMAHADERITDFVVLVNEKVANTTSAGRSRNAKSSKLHGLNILPGLVEVN
jgi:hypothetical protein